MTTIDNTPLPDDMKPQFDKAVSDKFHFPELEGALLAHEALNVIFPPLLRGEGIKSFVDDIKLNPGEINEFVYPAILMPSVKLPWRKRINNLCLQYKWRLVTFWHRLIWLIPYLFTGNDGYGD